MRRSLCGLAALSMMWALLVAGVGMRMAYRRPTRPSEKLERSGKPALHLVLKQRAKVCRCARRCEVGQECVFHALST